MKIILFGSTGMLGSYIKKWLLNNTEFVNIMCITRKEFDIESSNWELLFSLLNTLIEVDDVIINCAGAIPQKNPDIRKYINVNTIFPHKLSEFVKLKGNPFIHITTDCVFSGKKISYNENDIHDAEDIYGISKSLGEPIDACIIRTSIIGEEKYGKKSLLEWVKSCKNTTIEGYNHFFWNGITCLELAKTIAIIIENQSYWKGVRHFFSSSTVSKYQLCNIINDIYDLQIVIKENPSVKKNMSLSSIYTNPLRDIQELIKEQYLYAL